ncbi:hypothetical protein DUNSADRAFT_17339 [Dunaliella salina]|uniref:HIT-type domain-containing protein n=1 Tax=Dunaliella salina TaxID=3046 RepID=A0ABQ7H050_DUNSA|nr:hypothetical protein DUNSADRAFT_17339 [Dunaliella salina]|eukprot:KAF5840236.1 hypothetical protein DUNSADRAFT_17339 [Dunaliella salina]
MAQAEENEEQLYSGSLSEYESSEEEEGEEESAQDAEEALMKAETLVAASAAAAAAGLCAVCMQQPYKYCCPGCGCRSCSLPCSKQHKANTGCTGQKDRLGYVALQEFDDKQLLSDYRLLEEVRRVDDVARRCRPIAPKPQLPPHLAGLVYQAGRRRVRLLLMPPGMHRRITNTTRYDLKARKISWRVEWVFASAGIRYTDNSVPEECILTEVLARHVLPAPGTAAKAFPLRGYAEAGLPQLRVFLRKERTPVRASVPLTSRWLLCSHDRSRSDMLA